MQLYSEETLKALKAFISPANLGTHFTKCGYLGQFMAAAESG